VLFAAIYTTTNTSEEAQQRSLQLFTSWQPPIDFKAHWARADGNGGIAIFEADDATVVLEAIAPFTPFFDFETVPVVDIEQAVPVFAKSQEWRASVG
jgi:hypothetical protein